MQFAGQSARGTALSEGSGGSEGNADFDGATVIQINPLVFSDILTSRWTFNRIEFTFIRVAPRESDFELESSRDPIEGHRFSRMADSALNESGKRGIAFVSRRGEQLPSTLQPFTQIAQPDAMRVTRVLPR